MARSQGLSRAAFLQSDIDATHSAGTERIQIRGIAEGWNRVRANGPSGKRQYGFPGLYLEWLIVEVSDHLKIKALFLFVTLVAGVFEDKQP